MMKWVIYTVTVPVYEIAHKNDELLIFKKSIASTNTILRVKRESDPCTIHAM